MFRRHNRFRISKKKKRKKKGGETPKEEGTIDKAVINLGPEVYNNFISLAQLQTRFPWCLQGDILILSPKG